MRFSYLKSVVHGNLSFAIFILIYRATLIDEQQ